MGQADVGIRIFLMDEAAAGLSNLTDSFGGLFLSVRGLNAILRDVPPGMEGVVGTLIGLTGVTGAAAGAVGEMTNAAADLQDSMNHVSLAVDGASSVLPQMQSNIITLANNSIYSTAQIADGFSLLGEKGFNASDIMDSALGPSMVNLAEATQSQTVPAAQLLGSTLQVFGGQASDAAHYADVLTYAFYHGLPSITQLQAAIAQTGGVAHEMNFTIDQTAMILDYFAQNGLSGSAAATSLKSILASLADPTAKATQELAALGVVTENQATPAFKDFERQLRNSGSAGRHAVSDFNGTLYSLQNLYNEGRKAGTIGTDQSFLQWAMSIGMVNNALYDANGQFKGLDGLVNVLGDHLRGLNPQQLQIALQNLFNKTGVKGADILFQNLGLTKQKLADMDAALGKFSGGAGKDAESRVSTLKGKLAEFGTTMTDMAAVMGQGFIGPLSNVVGGLNSFISGLIQHHPHALRFIADMAQGSVVVGGMSLAVIVLFSLLTPITGVIILVTLVVLGLSAAFAFLKEHWSQIVGFIAANQWTWPLVGAAIGGLAGLIVAFAVPALVGLAAATWATVAPMLASAAATLAWAWPFILIGIVVGAVVAIVVLAITHWSDITKWFSGVWHVIMEGIHAAIAWLGNAIHAVIQGIVNGFKWFFNLIVLIATTYIHIWLAIMTFPIKLVAGFFVWLFHHNYYFEAFVKFIVAFAQYLWAQIKHWFDQLLQVFAGFFNVLKMLLALAEGLFKQYLITPIEKAFNWIKGALAWLGGVFSSAWNSIVDGVHKAWAAFSSAFAAGFGIIKGLFDQYVKKPFEEGVQMALDWGKNLVHMLVNGIMSGVDMIKNAVKNILGPVASFLGFHSPTKEGPGAEADTWMPNMMKMFNKGIVDNTPLVLGSIGKVAAGIGAHMKGVDISHMTQAQRNAFFFEQNQANKSGHPVQPVTLNLDGKQLAQVLVNHVTGQVKMNGGGRLLR
jgi:hypothetical protein